MGENLDFHLTFRVELKHVASLLALAERGEALTKEEISAAAGIPTGKYSGKVVPHLEYAVYMGLISVDKVDGRFLVSRTRLGSVVFREDAHLLERLSHLMCHYWLCSESGAQLWYHLWREFIPTVGLSFSEEDFIRSACQRFNRQRVNVTPLRKCYTSEDSLGKIGILKVHRSNWTVVPHQYNPQMRYLYAYTLLHEWESRCPERPELTLPEITDYLRWGNAYAWTNDDVLYALSELQALGVVNLNRQLRPVTVIRTAHPQDIVGFLYSTLI